ncbi:dynein axonemal heavy chain 3 [Halictus rubicundus]|uniref:dynein axonemal heavy chain 3 n=1 Tax=Halictus rubicundus TaxID=77578 RepID=UPI004036183C
MDATKVNINSPSSLNISLTSDHNIIYNEIMKCLKYNNEFPKEWEKNILNLLPRRYRRKYSSLVQSMLMEIKDMLIKDMQSFSMKVILLLSGKEETSFSSLYSLKECKGYSYNKFSERRKLIAKRYFLHLEPIRFIMEMGQVMLPTYICNFQDLCLDLMSLNDFQNIINNDVKKASLIISYQFYKETCRIISKTATRTLRNVSINQLLNIMRCITHIFAQQIINVMIQSIDHMLTIMCNEYYCPKIKLQLDLQDGQLLINPNIEEIYSTYHGIIDHIGSIAQYLTSFEEVLNLKVSSKYIQIKLPNWYIEESHNKLRTILQNLFEPINKHVINITEEFYPVIVPSTKKKILSLSFGKINFDSYLKYIKKYNIYLIRTNRIVANMYYTIGRLEQTKVKEALKEESWDIVNAFLLKVIKYHKNFNMKICEEFESLKIKALNIPNEAKLLIELTEYILHASKELIKQLECKIQQSIHMLCTLFEVTFLSDDHINLNKKTINWLHEIVPVFRQNNTLCEAMKNELEDDMQKRINKLNSEVDYIIPQLSVLDNMDDIESVEEYVEYYRGLFKEVNKINIEMEKINEEEKLFKFPETEFPKVIELQEVIIPFHDLIYVVHQWRKDNSVWLDGPFEWLDAAVIKRKTLNYFEMITEMSRTFKTKIKMDLTASKCFKFSGIADDPDPMQQPAPLKMCWQALNDINDFKNYLSLIVCMCNPALKKSHWMEMSVICNFDLTPNAGTSLRKMISFNLMDDIEKYEAISLGANRELELQEKLLQMIKEWKTISFEISFDEKSKMHVFSNLCDIELLLEDHFIVIEEMKTSHFVKPIISTVNEFFSSLDRIRNIMVQWCDVQVLMLPLYSTFSYHNIEKYLPKESALYREAKKLLANIRNKICMNPTFSGIDDLTILESLYNTNENLENVHRGVTEYIENKRLCFPRFFFLSDKEVQRVLFESNNVEELNVSLKPCFDGVKKVRINKEKQISSIIGDHNEEMNLEKSIQIHSDHEETWLIELENEINSTLQKSILKCWDKFNFTYYDILNFPSMIIISVLLLYWTRDLHDCFSSFSSKALNSLYLKYINHLPSLATELRNCTTRRHRNILTSLIIVVSNQKDIVQLLLDKRITRYRDFTWVAQLRYYLEEDYVTVSMFDASIKYGYEYSYYKQCIVNTTLTERCFYTFMQAYKYHLYGAVTGLSSTGKTETIKSLAKAIAVQFRIFNCANISSYNFVCQVFKGLVSCGAWLCFENFNSLELEMLSMITQNLVCVAQAVSANLKAITIKGSLLNLNPGGHICTTTNLRSFKYHKLPDNLKILFRRVHMMVPDINKIVEIELFAAGIINSKLLAIKLTTFYKLLSEQLQCESCNTFDINSAKIVVQTLNYLKRSFPNENETVLLLRSLIDVNLPKLCSADSLIFKSIVDNTFPDVTLLHPDYKMFLETLGTVCECRCLHIHDDLKLKIIQAFELLYIHRAVILVGDPLVGKTEILHVLKDVLISLHKQGVGSGVDVKLETIIPGISSMDQLYGHFDKKLKIWKDGICSQVFRSLSNDFFDKKWIVFDAPLKDVWIESLYTVLDTNKALHLTSGEKIDIADSVSIIFETMNIVEASPAVLLRCGVIYVESQSLDWRPYVKTHIYKDDIYNGYEETLYSIFDWIMDPVLEFIQRHCSLTLIVNQLHGIISTLNLLEMYLRDAQTESTEEKGKNHFIIWMQAALILSIIWGLGGNLNMDSHVQFNSLCISLWSGKIEKHPKPKTIKNFDVTLPHEGLIQDNYYIFKGSGNWKYWSDLLKTEKTIEINNEIFVPTINTLKYNHLLLKHIKFRKPFLICGNVSTGKTSLIKNLLKNKLPGDEYLINFFSFAFMNSMLRTQNMLLAKLNKIKTGHYGPPKNQFCISFIDDLCVETQESQSEINSILEFLRQYHSYGYFYNTNEPEKIFIRDTMFSLAIIGNDLIKICPRFLRHFNLYSMYAPSTDTIFRIFSNVLFTNFKKNLFAADVLTSVTSIANATIDIYSSVIKNLLPVPAKCQYQFSMRDVSKVINGCSLLQKESVETKVTFIRLWAHEVWRVFGDRILDDEDKEYLFLQIRETTKRHFKDSFETAFDYLSKSKNNQITKESFNNLVFSNFMGTEKNKKYEEITSMDKLRNKLLFYLNEYNTNFKKQIDIVITQYVLENLIKIARILAIPGGNLLMISNIGSGRKSITSLAAYINQQELFEPSSWNFDLWREDLKKVLQKCGSSRESLTFFIKEKQISDTFLCDIKSLLATSEIPDLFSTEERHNIIEMVRLHAQGGNKNAEISTHAVMDYFLEQCKDNLHIVICFNSTSKIIRSYLHKYPELVKYCTMSWHNTWPMSAFKQVGLKYIQDTDVQENIKEDIITACIQLYDSAREMSNEYFNETSKRIHVTLLAFLHMLRLYSCQVSEKQKNIIATRNRYLAGLEKLKLAAQQVEKMKATLIMLKPQLEISAQQTIITMKEVENENISVEGATILVQQEEEIANKKAGVAGKLKMECEADLAVAIPILEDAVAALNTLKPTDITLVKAMKNPPDTVKLVMAAVCVMLDVPPDKPIDPVTGKKYTDYWGPSKRILGDMNFLQNLKDYDKDNIPSNIMQIIKKTYISDNSFKPHIVAKASSAAEGLCKWVRAMVSYDEVAKAVAPKKEKLLAAQRECDEAEAFLNEKRKTLSALNAKLAVLNNSLQETLQQKVKLEKEVEDCTSKLNKAEKLIASLGGEKDRWMECAENLQENYNNLVGDMILSCGIISYTASYTTIFRDKIVGYWKQYIIHLKIPFTTNYNLINIHGDENEINHWYLCGLPKHRFSVENAIIMSNSKLWCLFIDSQNQANQWIKIIEKKNNIKIIKLTNSNYASIVRSSIVNGNPVLIENVGEQLETVLDPFLKDRIYNDENISYLTINRDIIKYSHDFRLYITTRLLNPKYTPEVFSKFTVIDFFIPNEALQVRLLDLVVSKEKPELQGKFEILQMEDVNNKKVLKQQEDNILCTLSSTTTNILEDENAIKTLDSSKNLSLNIIKKQEITRLMSLEISKFRDAYTQFVKYCVDLFNTLIALSYLNSMYCFSFTWFVQLYTRSIETSNRSAVLEKRLAYLKFSFTQSLYASICRSLSEKHKILCSFLLCSKILLDDKQATEEEIKYFMSTNCRRTETISNNKPSWLPQNTWTNICDVQNVLSTFNGLAEDFHCNDNAWKQYYSSETLQNQLLPWPWIDKSSFQKLILVKTLKPDKITIQIIEIIKDTLGNIQVHSPQIKVAQSYAESNCLTPILFILPSCSSLLSLISAYAKTKGYLSKFISLSMGRGQEQRAEFLLKRAQAEGNWVFLENCHLVPHWMLDLERLCENCDISNTSLGFRLWLSSYPIKGFPISILQNSIKISHDYPLNIKEILQNIYQSDPIVNKEFYEGCPGRDKIFSKLLFGLSLFHTIVKEKNSFGAQGWNIPYDFDHSDFHLSAIQLQSFINDADYTPFDIILYFIGECNYGGKVMDNIDNRSLLHLLTDYCNSDTVKDKQAKLIPQRCEYLHVIKHIEEMPLDLSSEVFGFSQNGAVTRDTMMAFEFLSSISSMNPIDHLLDDHLPQDQVLLLINDIADKLHDTFEINCLEENKSSLLREPLNRVLLCEAKLFKHTLTTVTRTLNNLKSAFEGSLPFTDSLQEVSKMIYKNKVPRTWKGIKNNNITDNLGYYIDNLVKRMGFLKQWMNGGCPRIVWLDAIFFGKMFFSAISLTFSEKYNVPVEEVGLEFKVIIEGTSAENVDAYFIRGLHLSGARWDIENNLLAENSKYIYWQDMPPICISFLHNKKDTDNVYQCPVYVTAVQCADKNIQSISNNYIINIPLITDRHRAHWIKCGTALYCHNS